jgi:undecaprenyl diphosphate synthase
MRDLRSAAQGRPDGPAAKVNKSMTNENGHRGRNGDAHRDGTHGGGTHREDTQRHGAQSGDRPASLRVPRHIGIIMDGNGRWARMRGMRRSRGHRAGVEAAKRVLREAIALGVEYVTLYAFSTENWLRSKEEVSFLMGLLARHLRSEYDFYRDNDIRVLHIGDLTGLPQEVQREIARVTRETADNSALTVNMAVNYGGRNEIVRAANRWLLEHRDDPEALLSEEGLEAHLDLADTPEPDLLIRTGGHKRLSNFLLWESAYAELYIGDELWPDWGAAELREAVAEFGRRTRNFGGMPAAEAGPAQHPSHGAARDAGTTEEGAVRPGAPAASGW